MRNKLLIFGLFLTAITFKVTAQRIVVDTASTNKYLITPPSEVETVEAQPEVDPSFGDRAMSIGMGILNRLKARLNLEDAAETIKEKKEKILGKEEEKEEEKEESDG